MDQTYTSESSKNDDQSDFSAKILIVGESKVGKSSLLLRYVDKTFLRNSPATVGIDFKTKIVTIPDSQVKIKLQLWDTAGQERFRPIITNFYKNTKAAILVFDITDQKSLENLQSYWIGELESHLGKDLPKVIVGNKIDKMEDKNYDESILNTLIEENKMPFVMVSALQNQNINKPFEELALLIKQKYNVQVLQVNPSKKMNKSTIIINKNQQEKQKSKKNCC